MDIVLGNDLVMTFTRDGEIVDRSTVATASWRGALRLLSSRRTGMNCWLVTNSQ